MITLKGTLIRKPRAKIKAPDDGCQRNGSDGYLKGAHACYLNGLFIPHGQVGLYYWVKGDTGLKIFIYAKTGRTRKWKYVESVRKRMKRYWKKGICPNPGKIIQVDVDCQYKDKKYHKKAWALEVEHMFWTKGWEQYANGVPYDWSEDEHKDHCPDGFIRFKKKINKTLSHEDKKVLDKIGNSYKMGDVVWCTKKKVWRMVDMG